MSSNGMIVVRINKRASTSDWKSEDNSDSPWTTLVDASGNTFWRKRENPDSISNTNVIDTYTNPHGENNFGPHDLVGRSMRSSSNYFMIYRETRRPTVFIESNITPPYAFSSRKIDINFTVSRYMHHATPDADKLTVDDITVSDGEITLFFLNDQTNDVAQYAAEWTLPDNEAAQGYYLSYDLSVSENKFKNSSGIYNEESNTITVKYDGKPPVIDISSSDIDFSGETKLSSISLTFTSDKPLSDFYYYHIYVTRAGSEINGLISNFSGSETTYTATMSLPTIGDYFVGVVGNSIYLSGVRDTASPGNYHVSSYDRGAELYVNRTFQIVITSGSSVSIDENQFDPAYIITTNSLQLYSSDLSLWIDGTDADYFNLNQNTGVVNFKTPPNYEVKNTYEITVYASEFGSQASKNVTINITNLNELIITSPSTAAFDVTSPDNTVVYTIQTANVYVNADIHYSILYNDASYFNVNENTGEVSIKQSLVNASNDDNLTFTFIGTNNHDFSTISGFPGLPLDISADQVGGFDQAQKITLFSNQNLSSLSQYGIPKVSISKNNNFTDKIIKIQYFKEGSIDEFTQSLGNSFEIDGDLLSVKDVTVQAASGVGINDKTGIAMKYWRQNKPSSTPVSSPNLTFTYIGTNNNSFENYISDGVPLDISADQIIQASNSNQYTIVDFSGQNLSSLSQFGRPKVDIGRNDVLSGYKLKIRYYKVNGDPTGSILEIDGDELALLDVTAELDGGIGVNNQNGFTIKAWAELKDKSQYIFTAKAEDLNGSDEITKQITLNVLTSNSITIGSDIISGDTISNLDTYIDLSFTSLRETTNFAIEDITVTGEYGTIDNFSGSGKNYTATLNLSSAGSYEISVSADKFPGSNIFTVKKGTPVNITYIGSQNHDFSNYTYIPKINADDIPEYSPNSNIFYNQSSKIIEWNNSEQPIGGNTYSKSRITISQINAFIGYVLKIRYFKAVDTSINSSGFTAGGPVLEINGNDLASGDVTVEGTSNMDIGSQTGYSVRIWKEKMSLSMTITSSQINSGSNTLLSSVNLTFTSPQSTSDFVAGDITVTNGGTITNFTGTGNTYTATLNLSNTGSYEISVPANKFTDSNGNNNILSNTFTVIKGIPLIITYIGTEHHNFSDYVSIPQIDTNDIPEYSPNSNIFYSQSSKIIEWNNPGQPIGGTLSSRSKITVSQNNMLTGYVLKIRYFKAVDTNVTGFTAAGPILEINGNDLESGDVTVDGTNNMDIGSQTGYSVRMWKEKIPILMTITSSQINSGSNTLLSSINLTFTSSVSTSDFVVDDITVTNGGSISNFYGSGSNYTAVLNMPQDGNYQINVLSDVFTDSEGNNNIDSNTFIINRGVFINFTYIGTNNHTFSDFVSGFPSINLNNIQEHAPGSDIFYNQSTEIIEWNNNSVQIGGATYGKTKITISSVTGLSQYKLKIRYFKAVDTSINSSGFTAAGSILEINGSDLASGDVTVEATTGISIAEETGFSVRMWKEIGDSSPPVVGGDINVTRDYNNDIIGSLTYVDASPPVTFSMNTQSSNGTSTIDASGNWRYNPNSGYIGRDRFIVNATDNNSNSTTVSIIINPTNNNVIRKSEEKLSNLGMKEEVINKMKALRSETTNGVKKVVVPVSVRDNIIKTNEYGVPDTNKNITKKRREFLKILFSENTSDTKITLSSKDIGIDRTLKKSLGNVEVKENVLIVKKNLETPIKIKGEGSEVSEDTGIYVDLDELNDTVLLDVDETDKSISVTKTQNEPVEQWTVSYDGVNYVRESGGKITLSDVTIYIGSIYIDGNNNGLTNDEIINLESLSIPFDVEKLLDGQIQPHRTNDVLVVNDNGNNKYQINGTIAPTLYLFRGKTYRFNQFDGTNANPHSHPMKIYLDSERSEEYLGGIVTSGSVGIDAYLEIQVTESTPDELHYQCQNHSGMGGIFKILNIDNTITSVASHNTIVSSRHNHVEKIWEDNPGFEHFITHSKHLGLDITIGKPIKQLVNVYKARNTTNNANSSVIVDLNGDEVTNKKGIYGSIEELGDFIILRSPNGNNFRVEVVSITPKKYMIKTVDGNSNLSEIEFLDGNWITYEGITIYFG